MLQPRRTLVHHIEPLTTVCQMCLYDLTIEQGINEDETIGTDLFYEGQLKIAHSMGLCYVCCFLIMASS